MPPAISLTRVCKTFGAGQSQVQALVDIDVDVAQGEFVAIVGASGCGKSTLLRLISGLAAPTSGRVSLNGHIVTEPDPGAGIVFQTPVLLPWRSVRRNVELPLDILPEARSTPRGRVDELLDLVGLRGFADRRPRELSGGMQQRVALCRALVHDPPLLLMDEPFGALDALTREQMNLELQKIWMETGKTVLLITHSITEAVMLADRVVVMTPRPGRTKEIVPVNLLRPRDFASLRQTAYHEACDHIRSLMNAAAFVD